MGGQSGGVGLVVKTVGQSMVVQLAMGIATLQCTQMDAA